MHGIKKLHGIIFTLFPYLVTLLIFVPSADARDCSGEYAPAQIASQHAMRILDQIKSYALSAATNIETCTYYEKDRVWVMRLEMHWDGPLTGKFYQVKGELTVKPDDWSWRNTWANGNLLLWWMSQGLGKMMREDSQRSLEENEGTQDLSQRREEQERLRRQREEYERRRRQRSADEEY